MALHAFVKLFYKYAFILEKYFWYNNPNLWLRTNNWRALL